MAAISCTTPVLESVSLASCSSTDSSKSPSSENMTKGVDKVTAFPIPNRLGNYDRQRKKRIIPAQLENKRAPDNPSMVFSGRTFMVHLYLLKYFPTNVPPISENFVTKIIQNQVRMRSSSLRSYSGISEINEIGKQHIKERQFMPTIADIMHLLDISME
jgi:hypothetical protein